ncbi:MULTISPECIES: hypothetical protein [Flavobacterium]|uniref:LPXTG-motif cell wall anchor domain-containing protein n=1 Tax=Flavobacterium jumunjinense TaxID=998845 RepID=A0ABV5GUD2_9FLAO|nr:MULTISPECIES: hypothetical protein [Flavobacterium]
MYQDNYSIEEENQGLNGWFGRFLKGVIVRAAAMVDSYLSVQTAGLSAEIGSFASWADTIGTGSGNNGWWQKGALPIYNIEDDPRAQYEPNSIEETVLTAFADNLAKIVGLVSEDAINKVQQLPFSNQKIANANALLQRIATVKGYYQFHEMERLSYAAVQLRNLLIESLFIPVEKLLQQQMEKDASSFFQTNVVVSIPSKTMITDIAPFQKVSVIPIKASFKIYELHPKLDLPPDDVIVVDNPPKGDEGIEISPPPNDDDVVITVPDPTDPIQTTVPDLSVTPEGSGLPWLLLIGGSVLVVWATKKKKKEKK